MAKEFKEKVSFK